VEEHPAFRSVGSSSIDQGQGQGEVRQGREEEWKRDSGVANTTSTGRSSNFGGGSLKGTVEEREEREDRVEEEVISGDRQGGKMAMVAEPSSPVRTPSRAQQNGKGEMLRQDVQEDKNERTELPDAPRIDSATTPDEFTPITTPIPTDNLFGENFMDGLSFSNRGSVMFGGKKAVERPNPQARVTGGRR
jgi:hypothetical protein